MDRNELRKRLEAEAKTGDYIHLLIRRCLVEDKERGLRELIQGNKVKEWSRLLDEKWVPLESVLAILAEDESFVHVSRQQLTDLLADMAKIPERRLPLGKNAWLQEWSEVQEKLKGLLGADGKETEK